MSPATHTRPIAADAALALTIAVALGAAITVGGGFWSHTFGGDLHGLFLQRYEYVGRLASHGRLGWWDPYQFCGMPLLGQMQGGALYPPVLVAFALFPSATALQVLLTAHLGVLSLGMLLWARQHGADAAGGILAALVASAGVIHPLAVTNNHPSFLFCLAWTPWIVRAVERALADGGRRQIAAAAVFVALQWLAGYPDFPLDVAVLLPAVIAATPGRTLRVRLAIVAAVLALGTALAAIQLVPLAEAVRESPRPGESGQYAEIYAHLAPTMAQAARRRWDVHGPAVLAFVLLAVWRDGWRVAGPLVAAAWCALAFRIPFRLLYLLPPFSSVRLPFGWQYLEFVFVGLLAAVGVAAATSSPRRAVRVATRVTVATLVGVRVLVVFRAPGSMPDRVPDPAELDARGALLARVGARLPDARIVSPKDSAFGLWLRRGLRSAGGCDPSVPPARVLELLAAAGMSAAEPAVAPARLAQHAALAARLGVGAVVVPQASGAVLGAAGFAPMATLPDGDLVLARKPVPRVRLVHRLLVVDDDRAALTEIAGAPDAETTAVVVRGPDLPAVDEAGGPGERAAIAAESPETIDVDAVAASRALLVVRDTFYPGWTASVDGTPSQILRVDHAFRGVLVPPGRHRVRLAYRPASFRLGAAISAVAALVLVALGARTDRARVRPPQ